MTGPASGGPRIVVGLMSGTSLDGISSAVVRFDRAAGGRVTYDVLGMSVRPYDTSQRDRLAKSLVGVTPREYCRLAFDVGAWLADAAIAAIAEAGVDRASVSAIASHGQTVWHEPGHSTWQIGQPAMIAERTRIDVVSDFRVRDVAAGGQGAPLVPVADALLFAHEHEWRALQNLGGIGNVTIVPPGGVSTSTRAFDTGPGVVVIDGVTRLVAPGTSYDVDGQLARTGTPIEPVVRRALADPYFAAPPPKSTGRELFDPTYVAGFVDRCRAEQAVASPGDIVATAVALTAASIADAFRRFVPEPVGELVLSGGGAENPALVDAIRAALPTLRVRRFDELFFDGEAKEAVAFALLGYLFLEREPGNLPSVTGARGPRILGHLTPA
ncbi:MAG TPA: anhydro-N-acetylmuramic acid kinase [Gemmatimonadaceae bacterium]|jgi:anhydro-N-acetylmuramic acid kinase|nr:anhydro-N-acetylmuramic acid kinase [Gemmatimonadaceae bacterium]